MINSRRVFSAIGCGFGAAFVFINANGLPRPWNVAAFLIGVVLLVLAVWRGVIVGGRAVPATQDLVGADLAGHVRRSAAAYWLAVGAEAIAIPVGALVINRVLDRPHLVVLWVVFVVGAHFLSARAFGVGRFTELGCTLMLLAVLSAGLQLATGSAWMPSAGAVLSGAVMLGFVAVPNLSHPVDQSPLPNRTQAE